MERQQALYVLVAHLRPQKQRRAGADEHLEKCTQGLMIDATMDAADGCVGLRPEPKTLPVQVPPGRTHKHGHNREPARCFPDAGFPDGRGFASDRLGGICSGLS